MDKPQSFVIWFRDGSFNHNPVYSQGMGHEVSFDRATRYTSREEAERVNANLIGGEVCESPVNPHRRQHGIGPRWVAYRGPRPSLTTMAHVEAVMDHLRRDAEEARAISLSAVRPMDEVRAKMAALRLQEQANALRELLRYINVPNLPDPLDIFPNDVTVTK